MNRRGAAAMRRRRNGSISTMASRFGSRTKTGRVAFVREAGGNTAVFRESGGSVIHQVDIPDGVTGIDF